MSEKENKKVVAITMKPSVWEQIKKQAEIEDVSASKFIENMFKKLNKKKSA